MTAAVGIVLSGISFRVGAVGNMSVTTVTFLVAKISECSPGLMGMGFERVLNDD